MEVNVAMNAGRVVLAGDLDFEARAAFIAAARAAIAAADAEVELDCSTVEIDAVDDAVIGMLVTLARTAQRRGTRVVLVRAPKRMRAQLQAASVAHFFDFRRRAADQT